MSSNRYKSPLLLIGILALVAVASACTSDAKKNPGQNQAQSIANSRSNYVPKNDVEGKNYNARLRIADDPTTILWCTVFPTNPSAAIFTVPIVGKLTSSNKRPYPATINKAYSGDGSYYPELPGPDGMYGASSEYRYGFRPDGQYVDFTGVETFCSTAPSTYQRQHTIIDLSVNSCLDQANAAAQAALKAGNKAQAQKLLVAAVAGCK